LRFVLPGTISWDDPFMGECSNGIFTRKLIDRKGPMPMKAFSPSQLSGMQGITSAPSPPLAILQPL
jgi:hypothetical protein